MSSKPKIVIVGSSNTDMVVQTPNLPAPGETVLGGSFLMNPGGKGANQAVAAARLGGEVSFIAKIGSDIFGRASLDNFQKEGINTEYVFVDESTPSGVALIMVDDRGENCISVASGANNKLTPQDIDKALPIIKSADFILTQLETPLTTVEYVARLAVQHNIKLVLNPAPAQALPEQLIRRLYAITPNETEAALLTGVEVHDESSAEKAAAILHQKGVNLVIITLGSQGAYVSSPDLRGIFAPPAVEVVDTTAAGDTFNGALVVALADGKELKDAIDFANHAAALSVTRRGAQASVPSRAEIDK